MKTIKLIKLTEKELARRRRRKMMLLWQGEQLKRFKPFVLVRDNERRNEK